jgi:uncharacterized damage-inducible protein DinB
MKPSRMFAHWRLVRRGLLSTIGKFSDEELRHAPYEGARTVAQIALHIADAEEGWFRLIVTRELNAWPSYPAKEYATAAAITDVLTEVHGRTEAYLEQLEEADLGRKIEAPWGATLSLRWIIWHVLEHEIHHRAELSLVLGLLGREGLDV